MYGLSWANTRGLHNAGSESLPAIGSPKDSAHTPAHRRTYRETLRHELSKALLLGAILALSSQLAAEEPVGEKGALSAAGQNPAPGPPKGLFIGDQVVRGLASPHSP